MLARQWTIMLLLTASCTFLAFGWIESVVHPQHASSFKLDGDISEIHNAQQTLTKYIQSENTNQSGLIVPAGELAEAGGQFYEYGIVSEDSNITQLGYRIRQLGLSLSHPESVRLIYQYVNVIATQLPNDPSHVTEYNEDPTFLSTIAESIVKSLPHAGETPFW